MFFLEPAGLYLSNINLILKCQKESTALHCECFHYNIKILKVAAIVTTTLTNKM